MIRPQSPQSSAASLPFVDSLHADLWRRGIDHFQLSRRYSLSQDESLSTHQNRLLEAIGRTLATRHQALWNTTMAAQSFQLFRGAPEDHYVSAFLDPETYASAEVLSSSANRVAAAIEVLRASGMTTYENRRITTGALLFGSMPDPGHTAPRELEGALRYSGELTQAKSFFRLCDGLRTLALVDTSGRLCDLVDMREWSKPFREMALPVPAPTRYREHCRATLSGGHVCLVLTPAGEIKIFAEGEQVFRFSDGRWRLTDAKEKYRVWENAVGDSDLASRLFQVAVDMAEERRGGLFLVLDDREAAKHLVQPEDLLEAVPNSPQEDQDPSRLDFHYLIRGKRISDTSPSLIESLAQIDGAMVLDSHAEILAFGAILQPLSRTLSAAPAEGGRTTAALLASRFGKALKISEDGHISFYRNGQCVWEI